MAIFRVPFINSNQRFNIRLSRKLLGILCIWNEEMPAWVISISDVDTQEDLVTGVALVTGVNLFSQFYYTGITGDLVAYTNGNPAEIPTFTSLGNESNVYYVTED